MSTGEILVGGTGMVLDEYFLGSGGGTCEAQVKYWSALVRYWRDPGESQDRYWWGTGEVLAGCCEVLTGDWRGTGWVRVRHI